MKFIRPISDNLAYALLGGPMVALVIFGVGTLVFDPVPAAIVGLTAYGVGWGLAVRAADTDPVEDSEDGQSRREQELELEKGASGGNSGGA